MSLIGTVSTIVGAPSPFLAIGSFIADPGARKRAKWPPAKTMQRRILSARLIWWAMLFGVLGNTIYIFDRVSFDQRLLTTALSIVMVLLMAAMATVIGRKRRELEVIKNAQAVPDAEQAGPRDEG